MLKNSLAWMNKKHRKNEDNKFFIAVLYKQSLILRLKTKLLA